MNTIRGLLTKYFTARRSGSAAELPVELEDFDPLDNAFIQDPYPVLKALREKEPVLRLRNGSWVLTRHRDIVAALGDARLGNSPSSYAVVSPRNREKYTSANVANNTLPFLDAPAHTSLRGEIANLVLQQLARRQQDLPTLVQNRLQVLGEDYFDLVEDFATPLCTQVMLNLFGAAEHTEADVAQLKCWSSWFFYLFSIIPDETTLTELNQQLDNFRCYMSALLDQAQTDGSVGLGAEMASLSQRVADISRQQVIDNSLLIMADGVNADFGVANAILTISQHPKCFLQLQQNPQWCGAAAAELMRFNSPSLFIARRALEDMEIAGKVIRKNSGVLLMLASANRDEAVFSHPETLDFQRGQNPYLTFGKGAHACLGRILVLNIVKAVLQCLTEIASSVELKPVSSQWESRAGHRWLISQKARIVLRSKS